MWLLFGGVPLHLGAWDRLNYLIVTPLGLPYNHFLLNDFLIVVSILKHKVPNLSLPKTGQGQLMSIIYVNLNS